MAFRLTRSHQVFLGLSDNFPVEGAIPNLSNVSIDFSKTTYFFRTLLSTGGAYRSGPLFGFRDATSLTVAFAAQSGYWKAPPTEEDVFRMDPSYILGWTDALRTALPQPLDWVGNWMSFPDGQSGHTAEEKVMMRQAEALGLVDRYHLLAFVGWSGDELAIRSHYDQASP